MDFPNEESGLPCAHRRSILPPRSDGNNPNNAGVPGADLLPEGTPGAGGEFTMKTTIRILHLEENPHDAGTVQSMLEDDAWRLEITTIESRQELESHLRNEDFDLILADYPKGSFDGLTALKVVLESCPETPFIFVSANMSEALAVEMMELGATDCVMKNKLHRLHGCVKRALGESEERTKRQMAVWELQESEKKFRAFVETSSEWIWAINAQDQYTYSNPITTSLIGYTPAEVVGKHFWEFVDEEDLKKAERVLSAAAREKRGWSRLVLRWRHKDGSARYFDSSGRVMLNPNGEVIGYRGTNHDITEKKQLEAQLLQAQRLEDIGMMTSGIAHDLNNVFAPILMIGSLLQQADNADERTKSLIDVLNTSAQRGMDMVKQLVSFAKGITREHTTIQTRLLLIDVRNMLQETFSKNIELNISIPAELWPVSGDSTQLYQAVLNLCLNARDAMPDKGTLTLTAENLVADENYVKGQNQPNFKAGMYVAITVHDTGKGMTSEAMDNIHDPFFTATQSGKGAGLGLPIVFQIVKKHGGFFTLESSGGKGTTFRIFLPAESTGTAAPTISGNQELPQGHGEWILVVDDEVAILEIMKMTLQSFEFNVLTAADGADAVALFAKHEESISLVVMDLSMPFMNGDAALRVLRKMKPEVNVICMSGKGSEAVAQPRENLQVKHFLSKPFTASELLAKVNEAMGLTPPQ